MKKNVLFILVFFLIISFKCFSFSSVGFTLGTEYGFGLIGQFGRDPEKAYLELGTGIAPLYVTWDVEYDKTYQKLYFPSVVGFGFNVRVTEIDDHRVGLRICCNYNSIMDMGFGMGGDFTYDFMENKKIVFGASLLYFERAYDNLLKKLIEEEKKTFYKKEGADFFTNLRFVLHFSILFGK